jgi:preprotein translocase subunit SecG
MSSRGTANLLTRATAVLAGLFFATSLILSILAGMNRKPTSILQGGRPAPTAPGPNAPLSPGEILKDLPGAPAAAPAPPAAPSGPQVPQSK